jgi:hypothetical protein
VELRYDPTTPDTAPDPASPSAVPRFGPGGSLSVSFRNGTERGSFTPASATESCRVWGHDRRPCGSDYINESSCVALGCCYRGFSSELQQAGEVKGLPVWKRGMQISIFRSLKVAKTSSRPLLQRKLKRLPSFAGVLLSAANWNQKSQWQQ